MSKYNYYYFEDEVLQRRNSRKVGNHTYIKRRDESDGNKYIVVRYRSTNVVTFYPDGKSQIYLGGYFTQTTKARINQFSNGSIFVHRGNWYYHQPYSNFYYLLLGSYIDLDHNGVPTSTEGFPFYEVDGRSPRSKTVRYYAKGLAKLLWNGPVELQHCKECAKNNMYHRCSDGYWGRNSSRSRHFWKIVKQQVYTDCIVNDFVRIWSGYPRQSKSRAAASFRVIEKSLQYGSYIQSLTKLQQLAPEKYFYSWRTLRLRSNQYVAWLAGYL